MKYVNNVGPVTSVNACPQPGFAERALPDDHPEILEFERKLRGELTADEKADRDMESPIIKAVLSMVNADSAAESRAREALRQVYSRNTAQNSPDKVRSK